MACSADQRHWTIVPRRRFGGALSVALAMLAALAVTACSSTPVPEEPAPPLTSYVIGAGDRVKVTVLEIKDMAVETDVSDDGTIDLPLVGSVRIAGRTAPEVRTALSERLARDFVKDPKVNVEVTKYRPFYVLGQVNRPGSYPFEPELDIRRAVAIAGGFNRRAETSSAYLVREVGDRDDRHLVDLRTRVFPGDVIEVDRRLF